MTSINNENPQLDDESDSSFILTKRKPVQIENDENNENSKQVPIIAQKKQKKLIKIKPVASINRIADNLKIKQEKKLNLVLKTKNYFHKQLLLSLENNKKCVLNNTDNMSDMSDLNWLNSFSLSQTGLTPLSPPQSPKLEDESDSCFHNNNNKHRPKHSFSSLAFLAIESHAQKRMCIKDIYNWIGDNYVYYRNLPSGSWKNSIRHNLTMNKIFTKIDKNALTMRDFSGKGSLWSVRKDYRELILNSMNDLNSLECLKDADECPKIVVNQVNPNTRSSRISFMSKPAIVNPKFTNVHKSLPRITSVSSIISKTNNIESISDMEAVNALLTMKSRSNSMPINDAPKKGRRKQILRTPTKNVDTKQAEPIEQELEEFDIDEDDEELNINDSEEEIYLSNLNKNKRKFNNLEQDCYKKSKPDSLNVNNNPLLELSRAASFIEDENVN